MNTKMMTLMLGVAAMLASCSSDDALQVEQNESGLKEVTITASLPDGMNTRAVAADDKDAKYCYLEIRNANGSVLDGTENTVREMKDNGNGTFSYTVKLNAEDEYKFLVWADNVSDENKVPTSLTNVPYDNAGTTIAFAANENHSWSNTGVAITLKHVVTRVSVKTTSFTEIDKDRTLTITVPTSYTAYNVLEMAPVAETAVTDKTYTDCFETTDVVGLDPVQMGFFYVLCDNQGTEGEDKTLQNLTLRYNGYLHNDPITLSNVPMRPNYHITIVGDVVNAGLVEGVITATVDENWAKDETKEF